MKTLKMLLHQLWQMIRNIRSGIQDSLKKVILSNFTHLPLGNSVKMAEWAKKARKIHNENTV